MDKNKNTNPQEPTQQISSSLPKNGDPIKWARYSFAFALGILCIIAIASPYFVERNKITELSSSLGAALLSGVLVYMIIGHWSEKAYAELRIKEIRKILFHKDTFAKILNENVITDILETCLHMLFKDANIALGFRNILKRYSHNTPMAKYSYIEHTTLSEYNDKYYKLTREFSYKRKKLPNTISFKCRRPSSIDEDLPIMLDCKPQEAWSFLTHPDDKALPEDAYIITSFKINKEPIEPANKDNHRKDENEIEYIYQVPDTYQNSDTLYELKVEMEVLQLKSLGYYFCLAECPTNTMHFTFTSEIGQEVHPIHAGVSSIENPNASKNKNNAHVHIEGWVFPNSIVVFSF